MLNDTIFSLPFMQRAFLAALAIGLAAPAIGTYLVQRRLALMGDGLGHVALTGVGLGLLTKTSPVWGAVLVAVAGAAAVELIRERAKASGDVALAMLFYGGLAGGSMLISLSGGNANLNSYLFGSILSTSDGDLWAIAALAVGVLLVTLGLRRALFAVCQDEEFARVAGLPVRSLNLLMAVTTAVTVTVGMRVVGVLMVSALMVVPVAAAQQLTRAFAATMGAAMVVGVGAAFSGVTMSYYADTPPGASIVLIAIAVFMIASICAGLVRRGRGRSGSRVRPPAHEPDPAAEQAARNHPEPATMTLPQ
ncbi:zinc transport system permease protein [Catenulispora sp. MAP12-49]|jgi:zinc transport system permease protein|uniref:metal ABC transporter permease n=1 Tax=unclassified Catenulispora TaxID=414885 RepID=UPI0035153B71